MNHENIHQSQARLENSRRPAYLTGSAVALMILGIWHLLVFSLFILLPMFYSYVRSNTLVPVLIGLGLFVSIALTASGVGVIRRAGWARPLAILGLLFLLFKIAFQAFVSHRPSSPPVGHWPEMILYLGISFSLYTRRSHAYFRSAARQGID
jgi:hypothetical protein